MMDGSICWDLFPFLGGRVAVDKSRTVIKAPVDRVSSSHQSALLAGGRQTNGFGCLGVLPGLNASFYPILFCRTDNCTEQYLIFIYLLCTAHP